MPSILKDINQATKRIIMHKKTYYKATLFLQGIRLLFILPILSSLFYLILNRLNISNLTDQTITLFLKSPTAILLLAFWFLLLVYFIFYELGFYFILGTSQRKGKTLNFKVITKQLVVKARFFLSTHLLILGSYFLISLPIVSIGLHSELLKTVKIPDFIVDELLLTTKGTYLWLTLMLVLIYLSMRLLYVIYFFVEKTERTLQDAIMMSWKYSKNRFFKNMLTLLSVAAIVSISIVLIASLILVPLVISDWLNPRLSPFIAALILTLFQVIIFFGGGLVQALVVNVVIETLNEKPEYPLSFEKKRRKLTPVVTIVSIVIVTGLSVMNYWSITTVISQPKTTLIAHRGLMKGGIENSVGSLEAAAKENIEMVEMDIQETKDGQFIVYHDTNLKRLTGIDKNVYDSKLDELVTYEMKQNGFKETISELGDYIDRAKELKINLLVEIKPHGRESKEMVDHLIQLLNDKKVATDYIVQSLDKEVLDKIKHKAPYVKTGYVIPLTIGHAPQTNHDIYVVEEFSINDKLISEIKEQEKELFIWTVNKDELLKKYLSQDVDGIISNNADRGVIFREQQENNDEKTFYTRVLEMIENM